jgi:hypothetical protein
VPTPYEMGLWEGSRGAWDRPRTLTDLAYRRGVAEGYEARINGRLCQELEMLAHLRGGRIPSMVGDKDRNLWFPRVDLRLLSPEAQAETAWYAAAAKLLSAEALDGFLPPHGPGAPPHGPQEMCDCSNPSPGRPFHCAAKRREQP